MWEGAKRAGCNKGPAPRGLALPSLFSAASWFVFVPPPRPRLRPRQCPFCLKVLWTRTEGHGRLFEPGSPQTASLYSLLCCSFGEHSGQELSAAGSLFFLQSSFWNPSPVLMWPTPIHPLRPPPLRPSAPKLPFPESIPHCIIAITSGMWGLTPKCHS